MTNTERLSFTHVRGSLIEAGSTILFRGVWYVLVKRLSTAPETWTQRFAAVRVSTKTQAEILLSYNQDYYVFEGEK